MQKYLKNKQTRKRSIRTKKYIIKPGETDNDGEENQQDAEGANEELLDFSKQNL